MGFDFDKWVRLAQQDPAAFEALRKEVIEETIKGFPHDTWRSSEGLQFRIDMERRKSKTPMGSCIRLSNMLKEKLHTDFYPAVGGGGDDNCSFDASAQERKEGEIIPLRKPAGE